MINGEQITKIDAIKEFDSFDVTQEAWKVTFHLADGNKHEVPPSQWTKKFVKDVFEGDS